MIRAFLSVGFWTLISRITGFLRDILLARFLGAGLMMDAFAVAFRLPNHFRAIFAEGAFNTAFVPAYTRIRTGVSQAGADLFHGRVLSLVLASQLVLLALVLAFTPGFVNLLAPGFADRLETMRLAVDLTRLTFPYLALVTLVVLWTGVLNADKRFAAGAGAPVLLNAAMITTLVASAFFASPAHAAAWGVLIAGFLEAGLLAFAAFRAGLIARPRWPKWDENLRAFFTAFLPAVIGAAGVQIAMLADTIIVTFLPEGGASALYYADRLYQLPIGVIGVAAGTVLLPEMTRLLADNRVASAHREQNRALALSWLLAAPFVAAFLILPEIIIAALFERGAFTPAATQAAASVLAAYAIGLPAIVAIRSVVASFHARGDTKTPLYASLTAIGVNLALKLVLWRSYGAAGLAFATAIGAILNLAILAALAIRQEKAGPDVTFGLQVAVTATAGIWLAAGFIHMKPLVASWPALAQLAAFAMAGGAAYALMILAGFAFARLKLNLR